MTTKPPDWRDPLLAFPDSTPSLGEPHPGFLYPDPIGFWTEIRRWILTLVRAADPGFDGPSALSVSAFVHLGEGASGLQSVVGACRPAVVLFLDEPAWTSAGWSVRPIPHHVPDPHRAGQVYQGFWGVTAEGVVTGKAPQHPSAHRFYRWDDMATFLAAVPVPRPRHERD